jgi:hypothetical protein
MNGTPTNVGQDHLQRTYAQAVDWYKNADAKAQVVLAFDGAFITILGTALLSKPADMRLVIGEFKADTWLFLALMCLSALSSIFGALCCLWSRIYSIKQIQDAFKKACTDPKVSSTYAPQFVSFFQHISYLQPEELAERLRTADADFVTRTLAYEVVALSKNVTRKHAWVNRAFVLAGVSVGMFLAACASYVLRL